MVRVHPDRPQNSPDGEFGKFANANIAAGSAGGQNPENQIGRRTVKAEPEGRARAKAQDL